MILVVIFYYDVIMMSKTVISIPHFKRNSSSGGLIFGLLFQQSQNISLYYLEQQRNWSRQKIIIQIK